MILSRSFHQPPMTTFKGYLQLLARVNGLGPNTQWLFYPGMLQDSPAKWWDDFGCRPSLHEGIDICFFRNCDGKGMDFVWDLQIPALGRGIVLNVCEDFLGQTLVVEHDEFQSPENRVVFVYSHLAPFTGVKTGSPVSRGTVMARVFDTRIKNSRLLSHLHLSCIELPQAIPARSMDWTLFPFRENQNLINPVFI